MPGACLRPPTREPQSSKDDVDGFVAESGRALNTRIIPADALPAHVGAIAQSAHSPWTRLYALVRAHAEIFLVGGVTAMAALLRLHALTSKSVWYDEAYVISLAQMSIPELLRELIATDILPPLYYVFMHYWVMLGTDPFLIRFPSVIISTVTVPLLYVTGRRLAGRRIAGAASALLAVSTIHLYWAQQARMYAWLCFLCLATTYFLVRALQERHHLSWVLFAVTSAAAMYTQASAAFYLAAQGLATLWLIARRESLRSAWRPWVLSQLGAALLFVPWIPAIVQQYQAYGDPEESWTNLGSLEGMLFQFGYALFPYWRLSIESGWLMRDALVIASLGLTLAGAWFLRKRIAGPLLVALFVGTIGLLALVGIGKGIVLPRTVLPASLAYYLLLGAGLAAFRRPRVLVTGLVIIMSLNLVGSVRYYTLGSQEDWREAATYIEQNMGEGDLVLVDASAGLMPLSYYLERQGRPVEAYGVPFHAWANVPPRLNDDDFRRVDALVEGRKGIWLVIFRNGFPDPDGELLPYLSARFQAQDSEALTKVRLFHFVPQELASTTEPRIAPALTSRGGLERASETVAPQAYFGAWVGERVNEPGNVDAFVAAIGRRPSIVHAYSDNPPYRGAQFNAEWATSVRASGAIPMLTWQPGFGYGTRSLASVAAGERDDYIVTWADQLRDWGHPIFLRMMWEQNSGWYSWKAYEEPLISDYVAAWRHIVEVMRARGATNVTFVWSPHVSGHGATDIMPTYPGDSYVDWVALDGYPFRGGRGDFVETFGPDYDLLVSSVSKPLMIAETSLESWSDELKASWVHQILGQLLPQRFPQVRALVWFDEKNTNGNDYSLLQDQGPLSRDAFRTEINAPYYASSSYGNLEASPIPPPDGAATAQPPAVAAPTLSAPAVSTPDRSNLLQDPSFEQAGDDGGWSSAWVVPSWMMSVVQRTNATAATGSYSMSHSSRAGESYGVYQAAPVVGGATYQVSAALRVDDALQFGNAVLELQSLNGFGGVMETKPIATWQAATDGWTTIGGTVRVASRAEMARVQVRVTSLRGTFYLDDFSLTRSE